MQNAQLIINKFVQFVVNPAILVLFSFGLMMFVYGLVEFLFDLSKGGATKNDGRNHMLWGLAGMFIMVSVFGIIRLLSDTFGLGVPAQGGTYQPDMSVMNSFTGSSFIQ